MGVPQNGWVIGENPMKMDDLGVPPLQETTICWWSTLGWEPAAQGLGAFLLHPTGGLKVRRSSPLRKIGLKPLINRRYGRCRRYAKLTAFTAKSGLPTVFSHTAAKPWRSKTLRPPALMCWLKRINSRGSWQLQEARLTASHQHETDPDINI